MKKLSILLVIALTAIFSFAGTGNVLEAQIVTTLAGMGHPDTNNGTGGGAAFSSPSGVASDGNGNLYVADAGNNEVRKVVISTGLTTTFAGFVITGRTNSTDTSARFSGPAGLVCDGHGNIFVADAGNNEIRKIVISSAAVSLFAGSPTGVSGHSNGTGTAATFNNPTGVTTDGTNLYVADYKNNEIRKIVISTGVVSLLAGSGSATAGSGNGTGSGATFSSPYGITIDASGNLYIGDGGNNEIRKIISSSGLVSTFAGSTNSGNTDGIGTAASFYIPDGVAVDGYGNLYVADEYNNEIRKIVISTATVSLLAGQIGAGFANGTGGSAKFNAPYGVTTYMGVVYVADLNNCDIRKITTGVGIDNLSASNMITLYPNPANEQISLKFTRAEETTATLKVLDITGKEVMSENTSLSAGKITPLDISALSNGIYFVKVIMGDNTEVLKFVKQ